MCWVQSAEGPGVQQMWAAGSGVCSSAEAGWRESGKPGEVADIDAKP